MVFKGVNDQTIEFSLKYVDNYYEHTGFIHQSDVTHLIVTIAIGNRIPETGMIITEIESIIEWFTALLLNTEVESKLLIMNDRFYFELLENTEHLKIVRITYDNTVPVPGVGGYSLSPGLKYEDAFKKTAIDFEFTPESIYTIIHDLSTELQTEFEIGFESEMKKSLMINDKS
jgi:hypothetical protein